MIVSVNDQAVTFLLTVCTGISLGIVYDLLRILRKTVKHSNIVINIEDSLYWIACAVFIFYILFNKNYGQIRGFVVLGIVLGVILYYLMFSQYFIKMLTKVIMILKKIIIIIIKIMFAPIKIIIKVVTVPILFIYKNIIKYALNKLTKIGKGVKIKRKEFINNLKIILKKI